MASRRAGGTVTCGVYGYDLDRKQQIVNEVEVNVDELCSVLYFEGWKFLGASLYERASRTNKKRMALSWHYGGVGGSAR